MPAIPLLGFAPDADPTTPGILRGGQFIPTPRGIKAPPAFTSYAAIGEDAFTTGFILGRFFAGSGNRLYELTYNAVGPSFVWTNVSRAVAYSSTVNPWTFCEFDGAVIAGSSRAVLQRQATSGTAFADLSATAPRANIVTATANFVIAFNTDEATYGVSVDRWWCSPISNPQGVWTPSLTTQATTGRLTGAPGAILAALPLGDQIVAYKQRAMFVGTYVGPPEVWRWQRVPGEVGACGPNAVCDIGGAHFIVGTDGCWLFDGTRPVPLGVGVLRSRLGAEPSFGDGLLFSPASCHFDPVARVVYFKPGVDGSPIYAYDAQTQRFGLFTTDSGLARVATVASGSSFDVAIYSNRHRPTLGLVDTVSSIRRPRFASGSAPVSFTTHTFGDPVRESYVSALRVIKTGAAGTGSITSAAGRDQQTISPTGSGSATANESSGDAAFDIRQTGRWHSFAVSFSSPSDTDFTAVDVTARPVGGR